MGRYRTICRLGSGGGGEVFLAAAMARIGLTKLVVIKVPRLENAGTSPAMFRDEARLAARLSHPNIVVTHEIGEHDGAPFIVMEFLDGQTLYALTQRCRKEGKSLSAGHIACLASAALEGLHHAHEAADFDGTPLGIVHRDVSPHNILVTYDGWVKVFDFGIAKAATQSELTETGVLKGKVAYMAPEQCESMAVDRRTDVFSMGIVLFEGLTGRRFWGEATNMEILLRLANGRFPRGPRDAGAEVAPELDAVCRGALAPAPAERYATAADMRSALMAAVDKLGIRVSKRELGAAVAERFAAEREALRAAIEAFRRGSASSSTGSSDVHDRPTVTGTGHERTSAVRPVRPRARRGFASLEELAHALRSRLELDAVFTCVNTRLILQVGVNLKKIGPSENSDPLVIARVMSALAKMGLSPEETT
jgi:serine/threonine-protein kinase